MGKKSFFSLQQRPVFLVDAILIPTVYIKFKACCERQTVRWMQVQVLMTLTNFYHAKY